MRSTFTPGAPFGPGTPGSALLGALLLLLGSAVPAGAQAEGPPEQEASTESVQNTPAESVRDAPAEPVAAVATRVGSIDIDGRIEEAAWEAAPLINGFVQSEPVEGDPASRDTEVRVLLDEDAIYVAARMLDDPGQVVRVLNRRDELGGFFDWVGISFDPDLTRRNAYHFRVNAAGVQTDIYVTDDSRQDIAWNAVWESSVQHDSLGWSVEFRIPLSQLRYDAGEGPRTWGFNVHRRMVASSELTHFALQSRRRGGGGGGGGFGGGGGGGGRAGFFVVSEFATLENVVVPSAGSRIELRPYALSSLYRGPAEPGDPFFDGSKTGARVGSDVRIGLGSSFTLDAAVNPDFGQVEADPAVINLSAFETRFQEQRPFFVEDAQVFDFRLSGGQNELFYSRRIGRAPMGDDPDGTDFSEVPDAATILGAAKLTGRTSNGLRVGALAAVTRAEEGSAYFVADGRGQSFRAEPRAEYGVLSAQQDLNGGASQVSGILTGLRRALPATGEFDDLPRQAYSAGVRFEHQWSDRAWRLSGHFAGSHVRGTPEAMIGVQRASNHYFQRPDATRSQVDSAVTSLTGADWRLQFDRQNTAWTGGIWLAEVTKGFEVNDFGFSRNRERFDTGVRVGYLQIQPGRVLRDYSVNFFTFANFSHEAFDDIGSWDSWRRAYTNGFFNLQSRFTLLNNHGGNLDLSWRPDTYSHDATRGGPTMLQPGSVGARFGVNFDRRRPYSGNLNVNLSRRARGSGSEFSIGGSVSIRPAPPLQLEIEPRFSVESNGSQYITSTSTLPYAATYGRRYLFGELERKTLSLETRVNYAFSPTLSLQVYAQGLLSSGDYVGYKQLAQPGAYDFTTFQEGQAVTAGGSIRCTGGTICRDADGDQHVDLDANGIPDFSFGDKDFNVRSLIGNAVLRWEYRPGSTIFFVWQRQQEGKVAIGDFDFGRDLDALWGVPADNRFIVKVNYWLGF